MIIELDKNKNKTLEFALKDQNNNTIDLTGGIGRFVIYASNPGAINNPLINNTVVVISALEGKIKVDLSDSDTNININTYNYNILFDFGNGESSLDSGYININGEISSVVISIKNKYGLSFSDKTIQDSLVWAHEQISRSAFSSEKGTRLYTNNDNQLLICNYVTDSNFDGKIDKEDIKIYEYLQDSPYTVNDLSDNIVDINFNHPSGKTIITMDNSYPTNNFVLELTYKRCVKNPTESFQTIRTLEELFVLYRLYTTLEPYKLQRGITSRSINGVSIDFDKQAIDDFIKTLNTWIINETLKLKPYNSCDLNGFSSDGKSPLFRSILINKGY